jgi:2-polyprenyl-6-hydroxyphenyl methylase/3-demethylubiquinone-9 3-methyltransferase
MDRYYQQRLSAERLKRCYEIAPPRKARYLKAEMEFVADQIRAEDTILDLGCGYGRTLKLFAERARMALGVDHSLSSLRMGQQFLKGFESFYLIAADVSSLPLKDNSVDLAVCIQNGLSAFHLDPVTVINEAVRVTRSGGLLLFSSYSPKIWEARLDWFELQVKEGLLGPIDYERTGNGQIVCHDGFTATTFDETQFREFTKDINGEISIFEVDESSLFCSIRLSETN